MANKEKKRNNSLLLLALLGGGALIYKNRDKIKKLFGDKGTIDASDLVGTGVSEELKDVQNINQVLNDSSANPLEPGAAWHEGLSMTPERYNEMFAVSEEVPGNPVPDWNNPNLITQGDVNTHALNQQLIGNQNNTESIMMNQNTPDPNANFWTGKPWTDAWQNNVANYLSGSDAIDAEMAEYHAGRNPGSSYDATNPYNLYDSLEVSDTSSFTDNINEIADIDETSNFNNFMNQMQGGDNSLASA